MRDLPHHMKKLNRRVIRSCLRDASQEEMNLNPPAWKRSKEEQRKLEKTGMRKERENRTPIHKTEEDRNWEMKHRTPIFDRNNAKPRKAKPTKKKTPRI